jgi:excinuclease UvrABC nuclease subunit
MIHNSKLTIRGYREQVKMARNILRGHVRRVVSDLTKKMKASAAVQDYESAALAKGQIDSLQSTIKTAMIPKERVKK